MTQNDGSISRRNAETTVEIQAPDDPILMILAEQDNDCRSLKVNLYCDSLDLSYLEDFTDLRYVTFCRMQTFEEVSIDCTPLFKQRKIEKILVDDNQGENITFTIEPLALLYHTRRNILPNHVWSFKESSPRVLKWMVKKEGYGWNHVARVAAIPKYRDHSSRIHQDIWEERISAANQDMDPTITDHILRSMGIGEFIGLAFSLYQNLQRIVTDSFDELNHDYDYVRLRLHDALFDILESYIEEYEYFDASGFDIEAMEKSSLTQRFAPRILEMQREGVRRGLESLREEVSVPLYLVWGWASQSKTGLVDPAVLWKTYYGSIILERMGIEHGDLIDIETAKDLVERIEVLMMQSEEDRTSVFKRCETCYFCAGTKRAGGTVWCECTHVGRIKDAATAGSWVRSKINAACWKREELL